MSGHSKWANIKNRKEKADAQRGKAFTRAAREIMVAAREGGGDPAANFRLRLAMDKARAVNMPSDNIQRAIKRAIGEGGGESYEEVVYEGYGPGGTAILLDIFTDNRNRTAGEIRHIFSRHGGNLGESGCVAWMFEKKGILVIDREEPKAKKLTEDDVMMAAIEAGAEDVKVNDDSFEIITLPSDFGTVHTAVAQALGVEFEVAEITMLPKTTADLSEKDEESLQKLVGALEDHDDVQNVYTNV